MLYNFCYIVLMFIIYSFLGYILEVIDVSVIDKKINFSRGFLVGPYIPIYGFGALGILFFLGKYREDLVALFLLSCCLCSALEYFTSYILEKIFHLRWWDYSNNKFNIEGRICLVNTFGFGLAGLITVRYINPIVCGILNKGSELVIIIIGLILLTIFLVDTVFSIAAVFKLKIDTTKYINKDATAKIKAEIIKSLDKYRLLHNRLFKAFPDIKEVESIKKIRLALDKYRFDVIKNNFKTKIKELKKGK